MRLRAAAFDALLRGGVLFLVIATPLALGTTGDTSQAAFQCLALALGLVWVLRAVWIPPALPRAAFAGGGSQAQDPGRGFPLHLFGHRLVRTGLGLPVLLFLAVVAAQLAPLPAPIVRLLSPSTHRLQADSLPGLAAGEAVDFAGMGSFLLGPGHDGVVERILDAPGETPSSLQARASSLRTLSIYPHATVARLALLLCLGILFVVALHAFTRRSQVDRLLRAVVLYGFALAIFGIIQRLSWNGKIYWLLPVDPAASPFGPFVNHNHFAALLVMIVPIATGTLMDEARDVLAGGGGRRRFASLGAEPLARLLLAAFVVGVMASAVVLSASRGAVLALVAALGLHGALLAARRRIGKPEALVALSLVLVALALSFWLGLGPLAGKLRVLGDVEAEPSLFSRLLGWRATLEIISGSPLLGTGLGTFPQAWKQYYPMGTAAVWHEAHNDYLQVLAEAGGIGFAIFAVALGIFAWRHLRPGMLGLGEGRSLAMHGAVTGIVAVALHSFVDFPLQIVGCAVPFVVLSAVVISRQENAEAPA